MTRMTSNIPIDGEYLKAFIISSGKTQADIAESVGRSPSYITNCIKRGYMQRPVMRLLETVHGIDTDRLCMVKAEPEKPQEAEPMTWDDLNMATAIEILLRIEKKLDAIIGKGTRGCL